MKCVEFELKLTHVRAGRALNLLKGSFSSFWQQFEVNKNLSRFKEAYFDYPLVSVMLSNLFVKTKMNDHSNHVGCLEINDSLFGWYEFLGVRSLPIFVLSAWIRMTSLIQKWISCCGGLLRGWIVSLRDVLLRTRIDAARQWGYLFKRWERLDFL